MQRRSRKVPAAAQQLADLIEQEIGARCGDDSTFEQDQEAATAVVAEALARLRAAKEDA